MIADLQVLIGQVRAASESSLNLGFFERIRMVKPYPGGKLL